MMRILVADKLETQAIEGLRAIRGVEVVERPTLTKDELSTALEGVHVLVVRSKQVSRAAIEAASSLALIVRAGAGTNTIDVAAASERGIYVANCPGKNAIAVAELAMAMILSLDRRVAQATESLRQGKWEKADYSKAIGLFGRRIGIAGLGAIGGEVLVRARAMGMAPTVWSRSLSPSRADELGVGYAHSLEALAATSDILTLHLPLSSDTRGICNEQVLSALPKNAIFINTSRAEVVDYDALNRVAKEKSLRLGLDVFPSEPEGGTASFSNPILNHPVVLATPHIGASTEQAQLAIAAEAVRIVQSFIENGEVPNCVNIAQKSPAVAQLVIRHYDRVGVLAAVLGVIKKHGINVKEMVNIPFAGNNAACAKLRLEQHPSEECVHEIRFSTPDVIHVEVLKL